VSVPVLEAIADAIYLYEGSKARDRAYRNRNPGNLRATDAMTPQDEQHYRIFPSFIHGYSALLDDLWSKATGHNQHGLNFDSSLLDLFKVYAPTGDLNQPEKYAEHVAFWLRGVYHEPTINTSTQFFRLYAIAREDKPSGVPAA
jgi:hypothetical protein